MDSILDSCFELDPLGIEKRIFQHVEKNLDFHLEEINLRESKIDKDKIESNSQSTPNNMEDSNFSQVVDQSKFHFPEVTLKELEVCKDQPKSSLQNNLSEFYI